MAPIWSWVGALLALPLALAGNHGDAVPKSYIVEFRNSQVSTDNFVSILNRAGIPVSLDRDLSFSLFHGGAFSLLGDDDETAVAKKILSLPYVKNVSPVRELHAPRRQFSTANDASSPNGRAHPLKRRSVDYAIGSNDIPHHMTGVDKLRREGYLGSGLRVAVVDSGIDYKHPALGGCFGEGCLVAFGHNLVEDTADPYDDCDGHGTHVSGLIAAQPNPYNFTGVAPNVTLGHYKVTNCHKGSTTDMIMQAFKMAFEAKADIITASIGGYSGWSEEPWGVLIQRIVAAGVPCTVAVGNEGNYGMFYSSDGVDNMAGTGVGAVNNENAPMLLNKGFYSSRNGTKEFGWLISGDADFTNGTYQLYPLSLNSSVVGDGCAALPPNTPDLAKKIVLIRRGGCGFQTKATNAAKAGAKNILFYNTEPGVAGFTIEKNGLSGIGMVPKNTGEKWVKLAAQKASIYLKMTSKKSAGTLFLTEKNNQAGGFVGSFSQWGPTNELLSLPTATSPGGFMLSTYPLALGGYAIEDGTSMATPYFAGCIALLLEARGKIPVTTIQSLFAANANPNVFHDGVSAYSWLSSVAQQGAGLINAYDALHTTTILNVSSIGFNDTQFIAPVSFRINNTGSDIATFTIDQVGSGTVYALADDGTTVPQNFESGAFMETVTECASLEFTQRRVVVAPGKSAIVKVTAQPPKGLNAARIPVYSGYVTLNGTNGDSFSIPYLGVATSMRNVTILDTKHGENVLMSSDSKTPVKSGEIFTFAGANGTSTNNPYFTLRMSMGTRLLEADIKSKNGTAIGSLPSYPIKFQSRSVTGPREVSWEGQLADGSYVPAGTYSLRFRALKIFGNPKKAADFEVVETPPFQVKYTTAT